MSDADDNVETADLQSQANDGFYSWVSANLLCSSQPLHARCIRGLQQGQKARSIQPGFNEAQVQSLLLIGR